MKTKVFLDMDGVLVDFVSGACAAHGMPNPYKVDPIKSRGEWGIEALLGVSPAMFWKPLGFEFWANLDWMPDGREILKQVEFFVDIENICILTSPCDTPGCIDGKREWIKNNIPEYRKQILVGAAKQFVAGPGKVLIDDYQNNTDKFIDHGGEAVLIPRIWNSSWMFEKERSSSLAIGGYFGKPTIRG
jgi:5'(3')-deoxyribonucleotidase